MLDFLPDTHVEKAAILIYDSYCEILNCNYGKIIRKYGAVEAPNIKSGLHGETTIVSQIRKFAANKKNMAWYLAWFGLQSEELVFWLMSEDSEDYKAASTIFPKANAVYDDESISFAKAIGFLENKINSVSTELQKEIEIASQIGNNIRKYKEKDIEKADKLFRQIGKDGESLIAEYLEKCKTAKKIESFRWMNINKESGAPFDFIVNENSSTEQFIDVKSTRFDFEQYIYFSNDEIGFIHELNDERRYSVYRVFDMDTQEKKLKICNRCLDYVSQIRRSMDDFQCKMTECHTILQNIKIGVKPNTCFMDIQQKLIL